jgi:type II pantothenate kinase
MAGNNSDPIQEVLGAGVKHEAEEEEEEGEGEGQGTTSSPAQATATTMLPRSSSRPQLDLSGAAIHGTLEDRNPTILLPNQSDDISHLALDIGGTCVCRAHLPASAFQCWIRQLTSSIWCVLLGSSVLRRPGA